MGDSAWFADAADAKRYITEVGRIWFVWLLGLAALAFSEGIVAVVVGLTLLVVMFFLMSPLQNRVHDRFGIDADGHAIPKRESLSSRDKALRELTYGRATFSEAIDKSGLWGGIKVVPWVVIVATLAAAAIVAVNWFEG